jgi:hypothetical protein
MAYAMTTQGVKDFIAFLGDKGLLNPNSASGIRTACDKVFSALDEDEKLNLAELDVDQAIRRFMNKNPGVLSPDSANVYRSRIERALSMLKSYNANPTGFKVGGGRKLVNTSPGEKKQASANGKRSSDTTHNKQTSDINTEVPQDRRQTDIKPQSSVSLSFPLRPDFVAQFIVPKDLTLKEAKRLGAYFEVLAVDFEPG